MTEVSREERRTLQISQRARVYETLSKTLRTGFCGLWFLVFNIAMHGSAVAETLSFQQGVDGYAGTEDLHLAIPENFTGNGHIKAEFSTDPEGPTWEWDTHQTSGEASMVFYSESPRRGLGDEIGLLRFRDLFGSEVGQIPPGSTIASATLTLRSKDNPTSGSANLHRVLRDWDESVRWDDFGAGLAPEYGVDFLSQIDVVTGSIEAGDVLIDVTPSVAAWSEDPETNRGWLFMPTFNQDIITVTGSALANVTSITVDLEITTPQRGEITVGLRHENAVAVLINRLNRNDCTARSGTTADDLNVTLDPSAAQDIHESSYIPSPLTGTWRPDAYCISDQPLCTESPAGALCGKPADGDWVLQVSDEFIGSGSNAVLVSWSIHLSDELTTETYTSNPNLLIDKRHTDGGGSGSGKAKIYSSEAETTDYRPELSVTFTPAVTASPAALAAIPSSGSQAILIQIPDGSNASVPVSISVMSDDNSTAQPTNSPLVFAAGGPTFLELLVGVGSAGTATLSTSNDAGLPDILIPVTSQISPIGFSTPNSYATIGDPNPMLSVHIPRGSNASSDVHVEITSSDPTIAEAFGAGGGTLSMTFLAGEETAQDLEIEIGGSPGSATLVAVDASGLLVGNSVMVTVREDPLVEYELNIEPYVQLGNPTPGDTHDQFVIAWETLTKRTGGPNADRFEFQYREAGDASWTTIAVPPATPVNSASRLHHAVTVPNLNFDTDYEYQLVHLRNGVPLAGETFQETTKTRTTGDSFRFTAFGNSGLGSPGALAVAEQLESLGTDLHLLLGDNVYNWGEVEHYGPRIFDLYGELMKSAPFVMTVGNHEAAKGLHIYTPSYFHLPENGPAHLDPEFHYSFDFGNVHFVGIKSGNGYAELSTDVSAWLAADLAASSQTWKIVFTHELPVTRDPYGVDRQEIEYLRDDVLAVAIAAGADLYIGGANHSFQRYLPITAVIEEEPYVEWATCDQGFGTTLIYPGGGSWSRGIAEPIPDELDPPMEFYLPNIGVGVFDVNGETLTATMVNTDGGTMDQIVLNKCWAPADCSCDDSFFLYGISHGNGPIEITVDDIVISVAPTIGTTASQVLVDLANAINAHADLSAQGISASATGNLLDLNAPIQTSFIGNTGLHRTYAVPSLAPQSLLALIAALSFTALPVLRRRRGSPRINL